MAHATRGRFGAIVFGATLTKETLLLFEEVGLARSCARRRARRRSH